MLVITRKKGEPILIGDDIEISISKIEDDSVELAVKVLKEMTILREELYEEVQNENREATKMNIELLKILGKKQGGALKVEMKVASQEGQINLSTVKDLEIKQIAENEDVVEAVSAKGKDYKKGDVTKTIDELNESLKDEHTYAEYSIHEKFGDVVVEIISEDTREVIMECPPKKILDLIAKTMELVGVAIDKKA